MQTVYALQLDTLTELIDMGNVLDGAMLHLALDMPTPSKENLVADFTEATFAGSTDQAIVWGTPFIDGDGKVKVPAPSLEFVCTGGTPDETIVGWYVTNTAGTVLLFSQELETPVHVGRVSEGVVVQVTFPLDSFAG
jgi:hypothetical protein